MPSTKPLTESEAIDILVFQRYPMAHLGNAISASEKSNKLDISRRYKEAVEQAESYRLELKQLPLATLSEMVDVQRKTLVAALAARERQQEEERPFNQPNCKADFLYWSKMSFWTEDELTALLLDRDPRKVSWSSVSSHIELSKFAQTYQNLRAIIQRAVEMEQIWPKTMPTLALAWAKRMQVDIPVNLINAVENLGHQIADWKSLFDDQVASSQKQKKDYEAILDTYKARVGELICESTALKAQLEGSRNVSPVSKADLGTRQRETLLKLVIGMAIDGYGYNPAAGRSPIAGEVSGALQSHGISISDDTIRSYLNEAKELLSR